MYIRNHRIRFVCLLILLVTTPLAHAQWAVVDVQAIGQLVQELQTLRQQLQVAQSQLLQAKQELQSMSGPRGMELLLSGTTRNYLPTTWGQLKSAMQGSGGYPALAADVQGTIGTNSVLSMPQLSALSIPGQQQIQTARQAAALRQAIAQEALANASDRFAALQNLIAAIPTAADQKGILDLQSRIGAELGMLQNEQTKLQVLMQSTAALDAVNAQRERELALLSQGRFASRFQPMP